MIGEMEKWGENESEECLVKNENKGENGGVRSFLPSPTKNQPS